MRILRLFDTSQFIASGAYKDDFISRGCKKVANNYVPQEIPIGGVAYLLREVKRFIEPGTDLVFCVDNTPTIKREIYTKAFPYSEGYKGTRPKKTSSHVIQRKFATEMLEKIGFNVISVEGYEADDCIASVVKYYADAYDKVYIHTRDSDLFYLVNEKVECVPVGRTGKTITRANWEDSVSSKYIVPWNTLTLHKMYYGEPGDNIPQARRREMDRLYDLVSDDVAKRCGDNDFLREFITSNCQDEQVLAVMELIMPLIIPEQEVQLYDEDLDGDLLAYFMQELKVVRHGVYVPEASSVGDELIRKYIDLYQMEVSGT